MSEFEKYLAKQLEDPEIRAGYEEAKSREYAADDDLRDKLTKALANASAYRNPGDVANALMPVVREAINEARAEAIDCLALELDYPADAQLAAKRADYWRQEQP